MLCSVFLSRSVSTPTWKHQTQAPSVVSEASHLSEGPDKENILKSSSLLPGLFFSSPSTQRTPQYTHASPLSALNPHLSVSTGLWTFLQCLQMEQSILPDMQGDPLVVKRITAGSLPHSSSSSHHTWESPALSLILYMCKLETTVLMHLWVKWESAKYIRNCKF